LSFGGLVTCLVMKRLFTERHGGTKPRVVEELNSDVRSALLAFMNSRIEEHWFGCSFPEPCGDGYPNAGYSEHKLRENMRAFDVIWPPSYSGFSEVPNPSDGQVFDLIEYAYEHVALPIEGSFHSYMQHTHYSYDKEKGRVKFAEDINRIFERNGLSFTLNDGEVERFAAGPIQEELAEAVFKTGDPILDEILDASRHKFLNRSLEVRRESLEKLWDAWERLKTIESGKGKKAKATVLLDKASSAPPFRAILEAEAKALTDIGNNFMIRHTETDKIPITESVHVDYLFQRMFAMLMLLLKSSGRV
jgi:hypothetical protein